MKYPLGIQSFEKLRSEGCVYVDKTRFVYDLTHSKSYAFLSRPRRFGKSLLLSTIKAYFEGKKHLFKGLALEGLETEWKAYPVIHIDMNSGRYDSTDNMRLHLNTLMSRFEDDYCINGEGKLLSDRFTDIIIAAHKKMGERVVILIDEYDKPLLEAIGNNELQEDLRDELRTLYSVLKTQDQHIKFALLTGVTKFGHLSVFSELNNITDISFEDKYAAICGITKSEMRQHFIGPIQMLAESYGTNDEKMEEMLRLMYDGYRFSAADTKVFNPYSLLSAFSASKLGSYWFATGTPLYLARLLKMHHYAVSDLEGAYADESQLGNMDTASSDPLPVIYQSGYLTITDYDQDTGEFMLGFPNQEVRKGFMQYLIPFYLKDNDAATRFDISNFRREILKGDAYGFMRRLKSLTADISYKILANCENDFHNMIYMLFTFVSANPIVERSTSDGRIDMVVETDKFVYIFEFKIDGDSKEALAQINDKDYALSWSVDNRKIIKIGATFSTATRRLTDYTIQ